MLYSIHQTCILCVIVFFFVFFYEVSQVGTLLEGKKTMIKMASNRRYFSLLSAIKALVMQFDLRLGMRRPD